MTEKLRHHREIGKLLTKAREQLSLTRKDVADKLNLKEQIISALDTGDYSELPQATYIRGYIRSYARIIDVNAQTLLNMYEQEVPDEPLPQILPDVRSENYTSAKVNIGQLLTYLMTFLLFMLLIVWWRGQYVILNATDNVIVGSSRSNDTTSTDPETTYSTTPSDPNIK